VRWTCPVLAGAGVEGRRSAAGGEPPPRASFLVRGPTVLRLGIACGRGPREGAGGKGGGRGLIKLEEAVGEGVLEVGDVLDELDRAAADEEVVVHHAAHGDHSQPAVLELHKLPPPPPPPRIASHARGLGGVCVTRGDRLRRWWMRRPKEDPRGGWARVGRWSRRCARGEGRARHQGTVCGISRPGQPLRHSEINAQPDAEEERVWVEEDAGTDGRARACGEGTWRRAKASGSLAQPSGSKPKSPGVRSEPLRVCGEERIDEYTSGSGIVGAVAGL
jgi:hypothetical protein